jgi:acid phosphatase family membrane protein YuiD
MMDSAVWHVFKSVCFWSPFCAWMAAQFTKMLCGFTRTRKFDFSYLVSTGGMPSAHSAMATGLAASVGITQGFGSTFFVIALASALVVMFDAATVRRASGLQARLLNEMVDELFQQHRFSERKLAELLGHTRLEVFLGMVMGIPVAMIVTSIPYLLR